MQLPEFIKSAFNRDDVTEDYYGDTLTPYLHSDHAPEVGAEVWINVQYEYPLKYKETPPDEENLRFIEASEGLDPGSLTAESFHLHEEEEEEWGFMRGLITKVLGPKAVLAQVTQGGDMPVDEMSGEWEVKLFRNDRFENSWVVDSMKRTAALS